MSLDYYTVLRSSRTSSFEEIKRNYKELIKRYHPDKQVVSSDEQFKLIDAAWKTLRDEELRRKYDAVLMEKELEEQYLVCGNSYAINKNFVGNECIIECEECSYVIVVRA
ncbi:hypothetical protein RN001_003796 [Aquatica leii]|uniref:J domain-containing protein n=1 Tax=Aquatica leii TaxID=1421715 RepID=A0AAN7QBY2_9COLE|nr:hypothetical protein RN001_003796 [Aquatica leii]